MTNKTITDLTAASALDGSERLPITQNGNSRGLPLLKFPTIASMAASDGMADGHPATVTDGFNGEPESFKYVAASTLTADGALVVDATGMGAGRWVSTRTVYADFDEFIGDERTFDAGTECIIPSLGAVYVATASSGDLGQSNAGGQEFNEAGLSPQIDYMLLKTEAVESSAESIALGVTDAAISTQWGSTFSGWGETYTPSGVSFNAIRAKYIGRGSHTAAERWRTIRCVIRTGASPDTSSGVVVAVGSILVDPDVDTLVDLTIMLEDPTTGEPITLSDADFTDSKYFIGIYADSEVGAYASMSYPLATQSNSLGQSYYISTARPATSASWLIAAGGNNKRVGFEHLLLTDAEKIPAYEPTSGFRADLDVTPPVLFTLPPKFYLLEDTEVSIYKDNLIAPDATRFDFDFTGATTLKQNERYMFTPTGAVAATDSTIAVYDPDTAEKLAEATTNIVGAASSAGTGLTKKCLFITDSLGDNYIDDISTIASTDVMGVTMLGTLGTAPNYSECRPGWTMLDYTTSKAGNAFWIGGQIDFGQYLTDNSVDTPDWVFVQVGTNDCLYMGTSTDYGPSYDVSVTAQAKSTFEAFESFIDSIQAADPSIKIAMVPPPVPTRDEDGFATSTGTPRWRVKRNVILWNIAYHAFYADREGDGIYICPSWLNLDTVNNFPVAASAPVNSRSAIEVQRQSNNVHPATSGYQQHADAVWAFLKCNV